ncbi:hypothetical protein AEQU2_01260 [Aequorivita lipolytica]|uniref:Lipoprotein n=2 Tax=Aequorivita lipolytica TaxID=153267 RepID=A0A5C6YSH6_9FLAO|nr:hypothetical protein [Aequorivita lipolytica]TXD70356.1 hypothetical protein ESV24_04095 [Aequorivita lipolytica]SRX50784.1 hypothetical protein AEQU2_01260 [Aequorivita lipolytica]
MKFIIPLLLVVGFVFSCGNAADENKNQTPSNDASIIFGNKDYEFPQLTPPAKIQAVRWGILEDFLTEAKNANGNNYQDLRNRTEYLKEFADSLFKKIPDTLNTKPIHSRLVVLKTRSELLFQASHQGTIDSVKVQQSLEAMNTAVTNLIVQLNEKFQKDYIDFQRKEDEDNELKKQKRYKDSIMNLELQDKKNKKL